MQIDQFSDIDYTVDDQSIATLTLNTPERKNAISALTGLEIWWALDYFENDNSTHALIITGAENADANEDKQAFSSGGYFNPDAYKALPDEIMQQIDFNDFAMKKLTLKIFQCDKPIFAAINGLAMGVGITLPLAGADQIYLSEHAWLEFPFARLGLTAELGSTYLLPRVLGLSKAKELLFFPERITAEKALQLGLCAEVVAHDDLMTFTRAQASKLIPPQGAISSIRSMKRAVNLPRVAEISAALDIENEALGKQFKSADFSESITARTERRAPVFTGK